MFFSTAVVIKTYPDRGNTVKLSWLTIDMILEIYIIVLTYPRKISCGVKNIDVNVDDTTAME